MWIMHLLGRRPDNGPAARASTRSAFAALLLLAGSGAGWAGPISAMVPQAAQEPTVEAPEALEPGEGSQTLSPELEARAQAVAELLAVYRRIPGLRDIRIEVEGRILELRGTALSGAERDQAVTWAREIVPGIVYVDARELQVETQVRRRLEPAFERAGEKGIAILRFLPTLILGLGVLLMGGLAAGWLGSREGLFARITPNTFARNLLRQVTRAGILLLALLLALDLMGVTALVGAVLGAAGVMGIAIGFAFRDIVENYLAGVLLSLRHPFAPRDHVVLAGEEGRIVRLTGRETVLMTLDGNHVRIPNATVFKAVITNMTRNPRRRFVFTVGVAPWEPLGEVIRVLTESQRQVPGVMETPPPSVRVDELQDSAVALRVSGWVDQTVTDFGKARSLAIRAAKEALESAGIDTPPPEYGIRILESPGGPPAPTLEPPGSPAGEPGTRPRPGASGVDHPDDAPPDLTPDTTIEDEIEREERISPEENLLEGSGTRATPSPPHPPVADPGAPS